MSKLVLPTTVRFSMIDVKWIQTAVATCAISKPMYAHLPVLLQELGVILQLLVTAVAEIARQLKLDSTEIPMNSIDVPCFDH